MKDVFSIILASKVRLATALVLAATVVAAGVTFGSWAVGSSPGNGYAKATSSQNLALADASASTVAQLYPGGTGDVKVRVTNPNPFAVTITSVAGAGTISSDKGAACDAAAGVTYTDQMGLSQAVGAGATVTFTLPGAAAMSGSASSSCQGAVFAIPVTLSASS
jgi:hypothetical protein